MPPMRWSNRRPAVGVLEGKTLQVGNYLVTVEAKLGEGGFADIYRVVSRHDQCYYALKHFRINGDPEKLESVKSECIRMKKLKAHANILTLYAACFAGDPVVTDGFCLLELCQQDLVKCLTHNHQIMTERDILTIFLQVAQGIGFMHSQPEPLAHWCVPDCAQCACKIAWVSGEWGTRGPRA
jgi:serine/threonine protein kinase